MLTPVFSRLYRFAHPFSYLNIVGTEGTAGSADIFLGKDPRRYCCRRRRRPLLLLHPFLLRERLVPESVTELVPVQEPVVPNE